MLFWWTKQEPWALFQNCYKSHQTHSVSVPAAFFIWTVDGDKVHLSGQGKGNLSSHCFPNQRVEQLTPGADDSHAAWVKSVRCLSSSTIFCGFYGIPDAWPKQQIYSEGEAGPPFNSGLTWQAEDWQGARYPPISSLLGMVNAHLSHFKGGEEGEWTTWPFPMIKMLIWWSQRNKLNCLFQPSILPGINQHHPYGGNFWRG